jgi:hypothetical protein
MVAVMSGVLAIFREVIGIYRGESISQRSLFWHCVLIAFVLSAAIVWFQQNQKITSLEIELEAKKKERPKPELVGEVVEQLWLENDSGTTFFCLLRVKNTGSLPSIVDGVRFRAAGLIKEPTMFPDRVRVVDRRTGKLVAEFHRNNGLEQRTETPISPGSRTAGWLQFVMPGKRKLEIGATKNEILFADILGREYAVGVVAPDSSDLKYFPGTGDNPFKVNKVEPPSNINR